MWLKRGRLRGRLGPSREAEDKGGRAQEVHGSREVEGQEEQGGDTIGRGERAYLAPPFSTMMVNDSFDGFDGFDEDDDDLLETNWER